MEASSQNSSSGAESTKSNFFQVIPTMQGKVVQRQNILARSSDVDLFPLQGLKGAESGPAFPVLQLYISL